MSNMKPVHSLGLIKQARAKANIEHRFTIPVGDKDINVILTKPGLQAIQRATKAMQEKNYNYFCGIEDGTFKDLKINEEKWENQCAEVRKNTIEVMSEDGSYDKESLEEKMTAWMKSEKPINLAEQLAKEQTRSDAPIYLMPGQLLDAGTKQKLCPTKEDENEVREYILDNTDVMVIITKAFMDMRDKIEKIEEEAKNSRQHRKTQSSSSGATVQKDMDSKESSIPPLTKS